MSQYMTYASGHRNACSICRLCILVNNRDHLIASREEAEYAQSVLYRNHHDSLTNLIMEEVYLIPAFSTMKPAVKVQKTPT